MEGAIRRGNNSSENNFHVTNKNNNNNNNNTWGNNGQLPPIGWHPNPNTHIFNPYFDDSHSPRPFQSNGTTQSWSELQYGPSAPYSSYPATTSSSIENTKTIEFGGTIISATPVDLTPVTTSVQRPTQGWSEIQYSSYPATTSRIENTTAIEFGGRIISATAVDLTPLTTCIQVSLGMEEQMVKRLNEEEIAGAMRTEQYTASATNTTKSQTSECCICSEEYKDGQTLGILDCTFELQFHYHCIKTWLLRKNSCPLCRMTGLITVISL